MVKPVGNHCKQPATLLPVDTDQHKKRGDHQGNSQHNGYKPKERVADIQMDDADNNIDAAVSTTAPVSTLMI